MMSILCGDGRGVPTSRDSQKTGDGGGNKAYLDIIFNKVKVLRTIGLLWSSSRDMRPKLDHPYKVKLLVIKSS